MHKPAGKIRHDEPADRVARGKAAREKVPRAHHAALDLPRHRDPLSLLEEQARTRVAELVPVRHGRMLASPFAFFRGGALIMAADLARTPSSGLRAQLCGDAHLLNFGVFGTPERNLVFDANDFDETLPGPWEWDLKRLAASLEIAGRGNAFTQTARRTVVLDAVRTYRETMAELAGKHNLDVWYARMNVETAVAEFGKLLNKKELKTEAKAIAKARESDSLYALDKLTYAAGGKRHIASNPPLIVPLGELLGEQALERFEGTIREMLHDYTQSLPSDRRHLFEQFRLVEVARKVVGVGSVGTRCWIALFLGVDEHDPLVLQIKEADASVLERFAGDSEYANHGERVVCGQRLIQASSDLMLGWAHATAGVDGVQRDFYVRQLRDWKGSFVVEEMTPAGMAAYGRACGWTLARAHARSGDRIAIAAYLGKSDVFDEAIATFADAYAELNERDHQMLVRAVRAGRISAETGL